jgi:hypothetical protein
VRWTYPVLGSRVAYFDVSTSTTKIVIGNTSAQKQAGTSVYMDWGANQLPNPLKPMDYAGMGLIVVGIGVAAVAAVVGASILAAPAVAALGVAVGMFGIITIIYGASGCEPMCPGAAPLPSGDQFFPPNQGNFDPSPDGSADSRGYGGGDDATDQPIYA